MIAGQLVSLGFIKQWIHILAMLISTSDEKKKKKKKEKR